MSAAAPLRARLRALLRQIGLGGTLGLAVLLACAAFYAAALRPAERELAALRIVPNAGSRSARPVALDQQGEDLRRFRALFPPAENLTDEVERLFVLARGSGLELTQGEYRFEQRPGGPLAYRVVLPVRGSYAQIRSFVGAVLNDMPIVSIDSLRFERKKSAEAQLDAQLRLTIHVRPAEDTP